MAKNSGKASQLISSYGLAEFLEHENIGSCEAGRSWLKLKP
jgi:hypothetical protein